MLRPVKGYETLRVLGAGGFGEVVLARHVSLDRLVAVKRIHKQALAGSDELERFRREAIVLAGLEHPAVVRVYDFRTDDGDAVLVMEYVEGASLLELLEHGPVPVRARLMALSDVADALTAGATHGIAHRDVKPGNVFVLPDGHAKLGDFGLARVVSDPSVFRTSDGSSIGTPAYFPPETGQGLSEPDARSDAYSFAVMAYEVLTGRLPYEGLGAVAMIAAHWTQEPPAPTDLVPGFPAAASDALLAGLSKDPASRPLPAELVRRLAAVPASAWPPPPGPTAARAPRTVVAPPQTSPGARAARSRRRVWVLPAVPVIAIVVAFVVTRDRGTPPPLEITSLAVTVTPAAGRCPSAHFTFTAVLRTNGSAGTVVGRWTQPNGTAQAPFALRVAKGQRTARAVLTVSVAGTQPLRGPAVLTLSGPGARRVASPPIDYLC
jgi:hypothetical protein